jgi:hypothetical protein
MSTNSLDNRPIVFFGTEEFSAISLQALINAGFEISAIITKPDSRKGRGQKLQAPTVKKIGEKFEIPVLQPSKMSEIVDFIEPYAESVVFWLMQNTKLKRRRKNKESLVIPETQIDIDDMEDMWRAMPPCIAALRNSHFPKNLERLQLTRIFVEAGISQKTATEFYETHHAKYPNGQDFKSRYDIAGAWRYEVEAKKEPIRCWYLIKAVKTNAKESLYCPFARQSSLPDGDELRSSCYKACAGKRFGGRPAYRIKPQTFESKPTEAPEMEYFTPSVSSEEEE